MRPPTVPKRAPSKMVRPPSIHDGQAPPKPKPKQKPRHTCCPNPKPAKQDDGSTVCMECMTELGNVGNIVSEVQFSEDAGGRATAQGAYVAGSARHANTLGAGARRLGGSDRDAGQNASANANRILAGLCPRLNISDSTKGQAASLYQLASASNFSAGRRTDEVVAACLYAVCRRSKDNQVLLIDISELQRINVFRLGEVYKALCKEVFLEHERTSTVDKAVGPQYQLEVESLIMKYCRKLEFGDKTRQVAEDAARILRRMKRDWIVTGRHPAGLCGACIIYAARMNNFRRTKREVVYVAKVADQTVALRMKEFQRTRAATMSVEQFREKGQLVKEAAEPPSRAWSELRRQKFEEKKRKREIANGRTPAVEVDEPASQASGGTPVRDTATSDGTQEDEGPRKRQRMSDGALATPAATQQEPRLDGDGFAVPTIPASMMGGQQHLQDLQEQALEEEQPKKRGRKPRKELWTPSESELLAEAELEREIQDMLETDGKEDGLYRAQMELEQAKAKERTEERERVERGEPPTDHKEKKERENELRRQKPGGNAENAASEQPAPGTELVTAEELEVEFADDPEVLNCMLPDMERKVKEQIWVAENEDWMRVQVAKDIKKRLDAEDRKEKAGRKSAKGRKKKGRMGDGSTIAEATTPIETPLDANRAVFERRGMPKGISKHINYEALKKAYGNRPASSTSQSRETSVAASERASSVAPSEAGRETASPTPAPAGDQQREDASSPTTQARAAPAEQPSSPPQTQEQVQATVSADQAAEEEDEEDNGQGDPSDYVEDDELDYGSDQDEGGGRDWLRGDDDEEENELGSYSLPRYGGEYE